MNTIYKTMLVSAVSLASAASLSAQKMDVKAKSLLDAVSANYKSKNNTYFKFLYGSGSNNKVQQTQTGIFYSQGAQYKLKIMDTEQIFDGKKIYNINEEDQEVTTASPNEDAVMFSPINYIDDYKKGYEISYVGKRSVAGKSADLVKLVPTKQNEVKAVYIYVEPNKKELVKLEQYQKNKNVAVIYIQEFKYNQNLSADMFTFNRGKYKNYLITDL
ncbi:LolA family protein [Riemerella columbina]|uniref:LolA family protein n=1 Tax=Riemerella columbina TaxID=103810 RepID=UPI000366EFB8|nr:outer membrane lipoprotein carrier protein LolA [Riemerella columbina]